MMIKAFLSIGLVMFISACRVDPNQQKVDALEKEIAARGARMDDSLAAWKLRDSIKGSRTPQFRPAPAFPRKPSSH